jgi:hypothetical protein
VEPPFPAAVLLLMKGFGMRKFANKNDWWDWGLILMILAGGTIVLWAGVWAVHSWADEPPMAATAKAAPPVVASSCAQCVVPPG